MNVQYEIPYDGAKHPWQSRIDGTSHDQVLKLLDGSQDQHIVGISEIREKEALLMRIQWEPVDSSS